jgi:hypothetical protein
MRPCIVPKTSFNGGLYHTDSDSQKFNFSSFKFRAAASMYFSCVDCLFHQDRQALISNPSRDWGKSYPNAEKCCRQISNGAKNLPRRGRISILGIPNELLLLIFTCLALSWWTLYYKIGPLVLDHPDLLSLLTAVSGDWQRISPQRTELLRRLEKDKRWLY